MSRINRDGSSSLTIHYPFVMYGITDDKKIKFPVSETGADIFHCTDWQIQETYFFYSWTTQKIYEKINKNNVQCNSKVPTQKLLNEYSKETSNFLSLAIVAQFDAVVFFCQCLFVYMIANEIKIERKEYFWMNSNWSLKSARTVNVF